MCVCVCVVCVCVYLQVVCVCICTYMCVFLHGLNFGEAVGGFQGKQLTGSVHLQVVSMQKQPCCGHASSHVVGHDQPGK